LLFDEMSIKEVGRPVKEKNGGKRDMPGVDEF
jgi:hypothetical protein